MFRRWNTSLVKETRFWRKSGHCKGYRRVPYSTNLRMGLACRIHLLRSFVSGLPFLGLWWVLWDVESKGLLIIIIDILVCLHGSSSLYLRRRPICNQKGQITWRWLLFSTSSFASSLRMSRHIRCHVLSRFQGRVPYWCRFIPICRACSKYSLSYTDRTFGGSGMLCRDYI